METKKLNRYKIEFYSGEEWKNYPYNIMLEVRKLEALYAGLVSEINVNLAEKIVHKCDNTLPSLYPDYSGKSFAENTAKESFQTLSDLPYCLITKL